MPISIVLLKLTVDRHKASRGLYATAELLALLTLPVIHSDTCTGLHRTTFDGFENPPAQTESET